MSHIKVKEAVVSIGLDDLEKILEDARKRHENGYGNALYESEHSSFAILVECNPDEQERLDYHPRTPMEAAGTEKKPFEKSVITNAMIQNVQGQFVVIIDYVNSKGFTQKEKFSFTRSAVQRTLDWKPPLYADAPMTGYDEKLGDD